MKKIHIKRVYDPYEESDGYRILADRLWPRGISKMDAKLNEWAKDFTPSSKLRKKFHQQEINWDEFSSEYGQELTENPEFTKWTASIKDILQTQNITLITVVKLLPNNHAAVLKDQLENNLIKNYASNRE